MNSEIYLSLALAIVPVLYLLAIQKIIVEKSALGVDYFSPLYIVMGALIFGSVIRVYWIYTDVDVGFKIYSLFGLNRFQDIIHGGLYLIVIGIGFFGFGYAYQFLIQRKSNRNSVYKVSESIDDKKLKLVLFFMCVIGLVLTSLYLGKINFMSSLAQKGISAKRFEQMGDAATSYSYLKIGGDILVSMALFQAVYYYGCGRTQGKMIGLIFLVLLSCVVPFVSSSRGEIVYLFLMLFVVRSLLYRTVTQKQIIILLSASFILIAVLGGFRKFKTEYDFSFVDLGSDVVDSIVYSPHFVGVGKSSVVIETVPRQADYLYGQSYLALVFAPIPRTLWREKPVVRVGRFVGVELFQREADTGVPPGGIAEAYINFGWGGVAVIMFLVGAVVARFHTRFERIRTQGSLGVLSVGSYAIGLVIVLDFFTTDFVGNVLRYLKYILPFYFVYYLTVKRTARIQLPSA